MGRKGKIKGFPEELKIEVVRMYLWGHKDYSISKALNALLRKQGKKTEVSRKNVQSFINSLEFKNLVNKTQEDFYNQIDSIKYDIKKELKAKAISLKDKVDIDPKLWYAFIRVNEQLAKIEGLYSDSPIVNIEHKEANVIIDSAAYDLIKGDPNKLKELKNKLIELKTKQVKEKN